MFRFGTRDWKVLTGLYILHLVLPFIFFFIIEIFCWSSRHKEGSRTATTILLTIIGTQNVHPEPVFMIVISCQKPVLRIRIRRIHMFLGLLDPDPFIIKQK
jgi:hypothetical protein